MVPAAIVGVGGATCSGKTTLCKHLLRVLPRGSFVLHQDDFAPPESALPIKDGWADWDAPLTAIEYTRMADVLAHIRQTGTLPAHHSSHDHLNAQPHCPIPAAQLTRWAHRFATLPPILLADGFLLYYNKRVRSLIDVRIFLRVPRHTLKLRREHRKSYATAEGTVWQDPPGYFDAIVWPAYQEAHENLFHGDNLDTAPLATGDETDNGGPVNDLLLIQHDDVGHYPVLEKEIQDDPNAQPTMARMVERSCEAIWNYLQTNANIPDPR